MQRVPSTQITSSGVLSSGGTLTGEPLKHAISLPQVKWSMRKYSRMSGAMSRLRGSIATRRVLDELEWHRWFAWYPVVIARDNERAYWAWLQFVERKTHWSRCT